MKSLPSARWMLPACAGLWLTLVALLARGEDVAAQSDKSAVQAPVQSEGKTCPTFRVREQDEVWLVSTRGLGCPSGKEEPAWQLWQYEKGTWQPRTAEDFFSPDRPDLVTPFYIHGNRIDPDLASSDGLAAYFQLAGKFDDEPPVRFVIWSWPSGQIKGPLNDIRAKAARCDVEAYYLARFLARM